MEENRNDIQAEELTPRRPLRERLDNFWYHYKWHSIVAVFLIITVLVCSLQMCKKEKYDTYILYAGSFNPSRADADGDGISEYSRLLSSLKRVAEDFDGNGEVSLSLVNYLSMTHEEIEAAKENLKPGEELNLIYGDTENLIHTLIYSEYYVCILSEGVYDTYSTYQGTPLFVPLAPFTTEGREYDYYTDTAIRLTSPALEAFRALPGIAELPPDTLICLRAKSSFADKVGPEKNSKNYENAKEVIRNILGY